MGKLKDVEGRCTARLYLGDDQGDNTMTFCCQLDEGHEGKHSEVFNMGGNAESSNLVEVTWERDMRCYHEFEECDHDWEACTDGWFRCQKCYELTLDVTVPVARVCKFCGCSEDCVDE